MLKGDGTMLSQSSFEKFDFLRKLALELGATDARLILANSVVVEDRVVLKCKVGCTRYGKTLACPPYAPTPEQFRRIVSEYAVALFMKFKSSAEADAELAKFLAKAETDPTIPENMRAKVKQFWKAWRHDRKKNLSVALDLEKAAGKKGYPLAVGFVSGSCDLCERCNLETQICANPTMKRYSEEGVGVNVQKTAKAAGVAFTLPFEKNPESFALLLID